MTAAARKAHAAAYEATLAALVTRAGRARGHDHGHRWTLGTGQQIRTDIDPDRDTIDITVTSARRRRYEISGIDTATTPTKVAAGILQAIIDGELEASIEAGQAAYRKHLG